MNNNNLTEIQALKQAGVNTLNDENPWSFQKYLHDIYWNCDNISNCGLNNDCCRQDPLITATCSRSYDQEQASLNFWNNSTKINQKKFNYCHDISQGDEKIFQNCYQNPRIQSNCSQYSFDKNWFPTRY